MKRGRPPGTIRRPPREVFFVSIPEPIAAAFDDRATSRGETRKERVKALVTADADGRVTIATTEGE